MNSYEKLIGKLEEKETEVKLARLYGSGETQLQEQKKRYADLLRTHERLFHADAPVAFFSAPGRTEICENHTDHNHGRVLVQIGRFRGYGAGEITIEMYNLLDDSAHRNPVDVHVPNRHKYRNLNAFAHHNVLLVNLFDGHNCAVGGTKNGAIG